MRDLLQTDTEAAYQGDPAALSKEEVIVAYPFIEAIAVQRLAHELYLQKVPLIPRIMTEWAHSRTGMDLHPGARIGSHFFIDHGTGTVIGETAEIGRHVKMYQGVGLVARSLAGGQLLTRPQTPSHRGGSRHHLRQRHHCGRRNGRWGRQHHRRQRFPHPQRSATFPRHFRQATMSMSPKKSSPDSVVDFEI